MKEYLTVAEASKELNITKQAVYQRLEKDLKPYLKTLNGVKMISSKAIKSISTDKPEEIQDEASRLKQETNDALKETIEILKDQLIKKDNQIDSLNERLKEASQRLSEVNSIAFKQIQAPTQAAEEDPIIEVNTQEVAVMKDQENKKPGLLKRFFNKESRNWWKRYMN